MRLKHVDEFGPAGPTDGCYWISAGPRNGRQASVRGVRKAARTDVQL